MKRSNSLNKLRIEKRSIQTELNNLKPKLSRGIHNTRKHQLDTQKIIEYTLRLNKIEAQIIEEENKLKNLRRTTFSLVNTPLCRSMFTTLPKHIVEKTTPQNLEKTFVTETPTTETEDLPPVTEATVSEAHISESIALDTLEDVIVDTVNLGRGASGGLNPISQTLPPASNNSDFQSFIINTVGLGKVSTGGAIPKNLKTSTEFPIKITSEQSSNWLTSSSDMRSMSGGETNVSQFYKNPLTSNWQQTWQQNMNLDSNPYRKDDDLFALIPPISSQSTFPPSLQTISEDIGPLNIPSIATAPQMTSETQLPPKQSAKFNDSHNINLLSALMAQNNVSLPNQAPLASQISLPNQANVQHTQMNQTAPVPSQYTLAAPIQQPNTLVDPSLSVSQFQTSNLAQNFEPQPIQQLQGEPSQYIAPGFPQRDLLQAQQLAQGISPQFNEFQSQINANILRNYYAAQAQPQFQSQSQSQQQAHQQGRPRPPIRGPNYPQMDPNFEYQLRNARRKLDRPRDTFLRRLRCIPKFSGDSYAQLIDFIEVIESLFVSCLNESEENELYQQILLQLRGEARNVVLALNNNDWYIIKEKLLSYFAYLANKEILTSQLENARQQENETLSAYADRVRNLLREKNATYAFMTEEQKLEHNRFARRAFSKGITDRSLRNRLITRGAASLEDAIAYAIEAENDNINDIPAIDLYCRKCNRNGHRLRDCKATINNNSDMSRLISALRSFTLQNRPPGIRNNFMQPNGLNRGYGAPMPSNNIYRGRNFLQNRNWNIRNENNPYRNWMANSFMPNRSWNSNNSMPNRNWNTTANRNWNPAPNQTWNANRNQNQTWNTNGNSNSNGNSGSNQMQNVNDQFQNRQNRNNFAPRQNDRSRQNNFATMMSQSDARISSSSENSISEN